MRSAKILKLSPVEENNVATDFCFLAGPIHLLSFLSLRGGKHFGESSRARRLYKAPVCSPLFTPVLPPRAVAHVSGQQPLGV